MTKETNIKIEVRKEVLELIRKKYDNICVGDYGVDELELILQELKEIAEMVRDKDKFMELKKKQQKGREKHINKYFDR